MTMEQFATSCNVSKATLYRKIKEHGLDLAALRGPDGELTSEGMQVLAGILDGVKTPSATSHAASQSTERDAASDVLNQSSSTVSRDVSELSMLRLELSQARQEAETAKREADLLRQMLEQAQRNTEQWQQQAERAQQLHALELQRMLPEKAGAWDRIRAAFKRK